MDECSLLYIYLYRFDTDIYTLNLSISPFSISPSLSSNLYTYMGRKQPRSDSLKYTKLLK